MGKPARTYYYRGRFALINWCALIRQTERYVDGYASRPYPVAGSNEAVPDGLLTKPQCMAEAKRDGFTAVFVEE